MRTRKLSALVFLGLVAAVSLAPLRAYADALSESWQCAKNAGMTSASIGSDLYKKGEAMATKAGPLAICMAKTGPEAQALMVTSSALTALRSAAPSLLPGGQCEARIKGVAAKPFANGLASLLPASNAKTQLMSVANSDAASTLVWQQIGQLPPPFSSVPNQIECGCLISDGALSLTDISEISNAVTKASGSCGAMLDTLGLGFINDIGSYAGKLSKSLANGASDKWDEVVKGESSPAPPGAVFNDYYGQYLDSLAEQMARNPASWQQSTFQHIGSCSIYEPTKCFLTLDQLSAECIAYYDDHKMSKANATKSCNAYRASVQDAAAVKAKQLVAIAAIPSIAEGQMLEWIKTDWLWRLPKTFSPGVYNYESGGSVSDWTTGANSAGVLRTQWSGVFGAATFAATGPSQPKPAGWSYAATGIFATAKGVVVELGNDPDRAVNLAYASALDPLREKARGVWTGGRKGYGLHQLREWYPTPVWGARYGCPVNLEKACAAATEAKFDAICFTPLSELYITGPKGFAFPPKWSQASSTCRAALDPVLAAAAKLDAAEGGSIAGFCSTRATRQEQADCNAKQIVQYRVCAEAALKAGKDDVGGCLAARRTGQVLLDALSKPGALRPAPNGPTRAPPVRPREAEPAFSKP